MALENSNVTNIFADDCPWLTPTNMSHVMQCNDGSYCNVHSDPEKYGCCKSKNGRAKCPKDTPVMCDSRKCDDMSDHCCCAENSNSAKPCAPRKCEIKTNETHTHDSGIDIIIHMPFLEVTF